MKHTLTAVVILAATSTMANAHDRYTCDRTNLSVHGFVNAAAADSWFPKRAVVTIADDKSWMHSIWGTKWDRNGNERKHNSVTFSDDGKGVAVRIFKNNKMTAQLVNTTGFKHTIPSYYKCVKSTTSWKPRKNY